MLFRLLLLLAILPMIELYLLLQLAKITGVGVTILVVLSTATLGWLMVRRQGLLIFWRLRSAAAQGRLPATEIADGMLVAFAAPLLMAPGLITDTLGFLLLIPATRARIRKALVRYVTANVKFQSIVLPGPGVFTGTGGFPGPGEFPGPGGQPFATHPEFHDGPSENRTIDADFRPTTAEGPVEIDRRGRHIGSE